MIARAGSSAMSTDGAERAAAAKLQSRNNKHGARMA